MDWHKKTYTITSTGSHTLEWRFIRDSGGDSGGEDNCGWVDFVQWTQPSPTQDPDHWNTVKYKYDPSGRRVEKNVDGYKTRYIYDGGNIIAEYDGNGNLTRKYIHGARVDELVCMIDVADSSAVYYYHYDGLGSVVALSDSSGDSCQSYEYSVYGQVAASDPDFRANPYLFTGRRFDYETGLYYYRARYYNPYIGRFLQTDPIGYGDGINWYAYCGNNPLAFVDPSGLSRRDPCDPCDPFDDFTYTTYEVYQYNQVVCYLITQGYVPIYHDLKVILGKWTEDPDDKHSITIGKGEVEGVEVFTLNGIGLLDQDILDKIIKQSVESVNTWEQDGLTEENKYNLQWRCDTPFFDPERVPIRKWLFTGRKKIDSSSDINYILEGHAMNHIGLWYPKALAGVYYWKLRVYRRLPTEPVKWWFKKGWNEYDDYRDDW